MQAAGWGRKRHQRPRCIVGVVFTWKTDVMQFRQLKFLSRSDSSKRLIWFNCSFIFLAFGFFSTWYVLETQKSQSIQKQEIFFCDSLEWDGLKWIKCHIEAPNSPTYLFYGQTCKRVDWCKSSVFGDRKVILKTVQQGTLRGAWIESNSPTWQWVKKYIKMSNTWSWYLCASEINWIEVACFTACSFTLSNPCLIQFNEFLSLLKKKLCITTKTQTMLI